MVTVLDIIILGMQKERFAKQLTIQIMVMQHNLMTDFPETTEYI